VILHWTFPAVIIGGSFAGLGLFLLVRELLPATPALGPALRRRHYPVVASVHTPQTGSSNALLTSIATKIRVPRRDLALLGRTPEAYVLMLVVYGLIGLLVPPIAVFLLSMLGFGLPIVVPALAGVMFAILFVFLAHRQTLAKAKAARQEFVRAVCTYLDLVALQLSASHGPVQALEQAVNICHGWVFERIREALLRAQMQMRFPWQELRDMSEEIGVPELGDVGAIMQTSGSEGAQVHHTLRQQADALRDQIRTDALAKAESVSGRLDIPGAVLVFVLVIFVIYPFMARI